MAGGKAEAAPAKAVEPRNGPGVVRDDKARGEAYRAVPGYDRRVANPGLAFGRKSKPLGLSPIPQLL
jgi:hypothetical protein